MQLNLQQLRLFKSCPRAVADPKGSQINYRLWNTPAIFAGCLHVGYPAFLHSLVVSPSAASSQEFVLALAI